MKIKIFKNSFIRTLASNIENNIEGYREADFSWTTEAENGENYHKVDAPWLDNDALLALNLVGGDEVDEVADARDSKALYGALKTMPSGPPCVIPIA